LFSLVGRVGGSPLGSRPVFLYRRFPVRSQVFMHSCDGCAGVSVMSVEGKRG